MLNVASKTTLELSRHALGVVERVKCELSKGGFLN